MFISSDWDRTNQVRQQCAPKKWFFWCGCCSWLLPHSFVLHPAYNISNLNSFPPQSFETFWTYFLIIVSQGIRGLFTIWVKLFLLSLDWWRFYIYSFCQIIVDLGLLSVILLWFFKSSLSHDIYLEFSVIDLGLSSLCPHS